MRSFGILLVLLAIGCASAAPSTNKVLVLSTTITTGMPTPGGAYELSAILAAGLVPEVVTPAVWATMTAAQFGSYRAIVLGDASCTGLSSYAAAMANSNVWLPQVTGNIIIMGSDAVYHVRFGRPEINQWNLNAVNVAVSDATKVGAYISLSCAYDSVAPGTPIPWLAPLGIFTARGVSCANDAHIVVASSPALAGLTDSTLSGWGCSVHNGFDSFPPTFITLAIARGVTGTGILSFADGSSGVSYIVSRGLIPLLCGDGIIQSPEQCDSGINNGVLGQPCSSSCRVNWCGDGLINAGEACDGGATNGAPGSSCDAGCVITGPQCVGGCGSHGHCVFAEDGLHSRCLCDAGFSGPQCLCNIPSYWLATDYPPKMDVARSGIFVKDQLTLLVNVSSKYRDTGIQFRNERNLTCNFPASTSINFWSPTFYGQPQCEWSIRGVIPWGFAYNQCIWQRDETANYITFSGEMDVSMTEDLNPIRGISLVRTHVHTLPFSVVFPKFVNVSSPSLTIYSTYLALAAIVEQKYTSDTAPNGVGKIRLYTSVQWPYTLQGPISSSSNNVNLPITVTGPEAVAGSFCPNDGLSPCQQWFDFQITPAAGQCNLNALYTFNFMVGCNAGVPVNSCPLLAPVTGSIAFTLESSYICQQVIATVDLAASLTPYATSAYSIAKYDFTLGLTGYYLIHTTSAKITIVQSTISTLTATAPNGTNILLYDSSAGGNTAAGNWISLAVTNGYTGKGTPANDDVFTVVYAPSFFNVPTDSSVHWSFAAVVNVVFFNTQPLATGASSPSSSVKMVATSELSELEQNLIKFVTMDVADGTDTDSTTGKNLAASVNVILSAQPEETASSAGRTLPAAVVAMMVLAATATIIL